MASQQESITIDGKVDDDSFPEEMEVQGAQIEAQDTCFSERETEIIRTLLTLGPSPSSKESKRLLNTVNFCTIEQTYAKILKLTRATNKELVHYLGVILRFPHSNVSLDSLVDMKFTAQEKHLNQLLFTYFSIVEHYYSEMNYEQRLKVFFKYIFLFSSQIPLDLSIYRLFTSILKKDFLHYFIHRKCFIHFPFVKNLIVDFAFTVPDDIIKIGYELPQLRQLAYVSSAPLGSVLCSTDWVVRRWGIRMNKSIPMLFYRYDCTMFLDSLAHEKFQSLENPLESIKQDLKCSTSCCVCLGTGNTLQRVTHHFEMVKEMLDRIEEFNSLGSVRYPLTIEIIRLLPGIDLKVLGSFLCKQKNLEYLINFAHTFQFKGMNILDGLRVFLSSFMMGGESQVIDRVMTVYAGEFCRQNHTGSPEREIKIRDVCMRITYGFIVLNTMIFNPTTEKRLSFDDYLKQLGYNETEFTNDESPSLSFDIDELRGFYNSIQENELKMPLMWSDGYDKFLLFKNQLETKSADLCVYIGEMTEICDECTILCYRHLFKESSRELMFLAPEIHFEIVKILDCMPEFKKYMIFNKKDTLKFLESARLYMACSAVDRELMDTVLDVLEKTEKPRTSMLPDLKSMFSKVSLAEIKEKPIPIAAHFAVVVQNLLEIRFENESVCNKNCELLGELSESRRSYVRKVCQRIIVSNCDMITKLDQYSEDLQIKILCANGGKGINDTGDVAKIKFLQMEFENNNITPELREAFYNIKIHNQAFFNTFCLLQCKYDDFDKMVTLHRSKDEKDAIRFSYQELCPDLLKIPSNVLKLFTSGPSILNVRITKRIHRDSCPVDDKLFTDFNKIVYLILKSDGKDRTLFDYASCVINYLSDSLILLINLYENIFPVFLQISPEMANILTKILSKRVKLFIESGVACCEQTQDQNVVFKIKHLMTELYENALISEADLKAFKLSVGKQDIVEL